MAYGSMESIGSTSGNMSTSSEGSFTESRVGKISVNGTKYNLYRRYVWCGNCSGNKTVTMTSPIDGNVLSISGAFGRMDRTAGKYPLPYIDGNGAVLQWLRPENGVYTKVEITTTQTQTNLIVAVEYYA